MIISLINIKKIKFKQHSYTKSGSDIIDINKSI